MVVHSSLLVEMLREGMAKGQTPYLTLISNSMSPLLKKGEQVGLEGVTVEMLRPGDILVCDNGQQFVTHRFWGMANGHLITKGDRSLAFDPPWQPSQLVGRVITQRTNRGQVSIVDGSGRWLNHHLATLGQWEARLFAGFSPSPFSSATTFLGRSLAVNRQHLLAGLVRRAIFYWATLLVRLVGLFSNPTSRGIMVSKQNGLMISLLLFMLIALLPGRAAASVQLASFSSANDPNGIKLIWITGNELDSIGFRLWRGQSCTSDSSLLLYSTASQNAGQPIGATYSYVDTDVVPNTNYDYRLESLNTDGNLCHQDFPVVGVYNPGGTIGDGSGGDGGGEDNLPTSTPAPTNTPPPAGTVPPTSPPPPGTTATATSPAPANEPTSQPVATNTPLPPAGGDTTTTEDNSPSATATAEGEKVEGAEGDENPVALNDGAGEGEANPDNEPTPVGEVTAVANVPAGSDSSGGATPSSTLSAPQVIGGNDQAGSTTNDQASGDAPAGNSTTTIAIVGITAGFFLILFGGIVAAAILLKKQ